jgi:hypothetical protein
MGQAIAVCGLPDLLAGQATKRDRLLHRQVEQYLAVM